jgi:hypothetical protein
LADYSVVTTPATLLQTMAVAAIPVASPAHGVAIQACRVVQPKVALAAADNR